MLRSLILLTAAAVVSAGCSWLQHKDPPQVTLVGAEPATGKSEGLETRMQLKLRVQNPNDTPIDFTGVYLQIDVQGKSLGSGVSNQGGTVPAFGETVVTVPVEISVWSMAGQAMGLFSGKSMDKVSYAMHGKLSGGSSGTVSFKSQGELNLSDLVSGSK
jgi:LEA14-like dessication related protein